MQYVNQGLPEQAKMFLDENRAEVGEPCWCCGLPITQNRVPIGKAPDGSQLMKHILRRKGQLAEEFVQLSIENANVMHIYLGLKIKPDGILAFGDGKTIQWQTK